MGRGLEVVGENMQKRRQGKPSGKRKKLKMHNRHDYAYAIVKIMYVHIC